MSNDYEAGSLFNTMCTILIVSILKPSNVDEEMTFLKVFTLHIH